jgi:serine/threonine protein kinase/tetratricopeptide (TPR) repeat protein
MEPGSSSTAPPKQSGDRAAANRHDRIHDIFKAAVELPPENRTAFIEQACEGDTALRADVERLLKTDASTASLDYVYPPQRQFLPGKELAGRFRVVRFIAGGGMGNVYEVEDMQLGEHVALKTIRPEIVGDAQTLSRFKREIQYAKRVTHPNVCRIHDLGSHREGQSEIVFLTMELLEGETLAAHLSKAGRMSTAEALPLVIQMAEALAAAHEVNIIHRDFKPSNVVLVDTTKDRKAIVTDFGLAQSSSASHDASITDAGKLLGTPIYMAPEQLVHGDLTAATDIYALGLVMYEMVTGRKPFKGNTPFDSAMKRLREVPPDPVQQAPGLDSNWGVVILRCLEREPARRFQSAREVANALTSPPPRRSATLQLIQTIRKKTGTRVSAAVIIGVSIVLALLSGVWALGRHRPPASAVRWYQEGLRALRDGTSFTAMNALERAVQIDRDFSLAHARLAEAATDLDYIDKAKSEMLLASPPALQSFFLSSVEKLRLQAVYFVLVKDFAQGAAKYKELAAKVPLDERASVLVDLGRAYEGGGKFQDALASYSESIARDNQFAAAFLRRAVLEGRQQQNAKAVADFDTAEQLYQAEGNAEGITEVLYQRSSLLRRTGNLAQARAPAEKALEMARNSHDEYHQARALLMLSYLLYSSGEVEAGQQQAQEAIDLARRAGVEVLAASGLIDIGNALFNKGDSAAAEPYLRNALETARRFQAARVAARAELTLGQVLVNDGRTEEGLAVSKDAILQFEQSGDKSNAARAAIPVARMLRDQGEFEVSAQLFHDQLQLAERVKDDGGIAFAAQGLGSVLLLQEQYQAALASFDHSAQVSHAIGDVGTEAYSNVSRADALRSLGRFKEAEESLEAAERISQRLNGNKPLLASVNFSRAEMDLSRLKFAEVERDVRKMTDAAPTGPLVASEKRLQGLQRVAIGRVPEGLVLCEDAVERAKATKNLPLLKNSELALAQAKLESGDPAGALALASALAEYFGGKGQHESTLRALAVAAAATRGAYRTRYVEDAQSNLASLRQQLGDAFAGFTSRPDIHQIVTAAGLRL